MKSRARTLRRDASLPEHALWSILRARRLGGFKFRRQTPVGKYVVDFMCEEARLVVELDGESHTGTGAADAVRDAYLRGRGLEVLRVTIDELIEDRDVVAEAILCAAQRRVEGRSALTPDPYPEGRGGHRSALTPGPSPEGRGGQTDEELRGTA